MRHRAPLLALLAGLALAVGWWFLLYQPTADEIELLAAETAELETREASLRGEIAELERIRDDAVSIRAELALMEEYIPNGIAQPTALRDLQAAADAAGITIQTLTFGSPVAVEGAPSAGEPGRTLAYVSMSMTAEGGYFQMVDLLRRLEVEVPRAVLVDSIAMSEGGEAGFPTLSAAWSGRMFAVVDVAATVEPAEGVPAQPGEEGQQDGEAPADPSGGAADVAEDGATS